MNLSYSHRFLFAILFGLTNFSFIQGKNEAHDITVELTEEKLVSLEPNAEETIDKLLFFEGSKILGRLISLDHDRNIFWRHASSKEPLKFNYRAIQSIHFPKVFAKDITRSRKLLRIYLKNGDQLRGSLIGLTENHLVVDTVFSKSLLIPKKDLSKLVFLPKSHQILFDSSTGIGNWKSSNSKSWTEDQGDLVSIFSGSTGKTLEKSDALNIELTAQWERSFYLAIRLFSDSDGSNYGNVGYHLSFSNNRINLQINKLKNGRIIRETLGSVVTDQIGEKKKAKIRILAHRIHKEFIILINDQQVARWKDKGDDFSPSDHGILFINQGGNSFIRLKDLSISGWNGDSFYTPHSNNVESEKDMIFFINGDSATLSKLVADQKIIHLDNERGNFQVPIERVSSICFDSHGTNERIKENKSEKLVLSNSQGIFSFEIINILDSVVNGIHSSFGPFSVPVSKIKSITCNLLSKDVISELNTLRRAIVAVKNYNPVLAQTILNEIPKDNRKWVWNRTNILAKYLQTESNISFNPHSGEGLIHSSFLGKSENLLTLGSGGSFATWKGSSKILGAKILNKKEFPLESGRGLNEAQRLIHISAPFCIGKSEVTQQQFEKMMHENPSARKRPDLPVEVNWYDAMDFCKKMNFHYQPPKGYEWRLPTEAEWEYSCRAGSVGPYSNIESSQPVIDVKNLKEHLAKIGWFADNSEGKSQPVQSKKANFLGLSDMHGNLSEWCLDCTSESKSNLFNKRRTNLTDPLELKGDWRILKGGSFLSPFEKCRSAFRDANSPIASPGDFGFRIVLGRILKGRIKNFKPLPSSYGNFSIQDLNMSLSFIPPGSFIQGSPNRSSMQKLASFSNGKSFISGSHTGTLRNHELPVFESRQLADLSSSITCLSISPNEEYCISGTKEGSVHLFELREFKRVGRQKNQDSQVTALKFNFQGTQFFSSWLSGKKGLYRVKDFTPIWEIASLEQNGSVVDSVEFSKDDSLLLLSGESSATHLIDAKSGKELLEFSNQEYPLIFSGFVGEENSIANISRNGILSFYEKSTGFLFRQVDLKTENLSGANFSSTDKDIVLLSENGNCSIRRLPASGTVRVITSDLSNSLVPDYYFSFTDNQSAPSKTLSEFTQLHAKTEKLFKLSSGIATSPDGKWIVTTLDGALRLWRKETNSWFMNLAEKLTASFIDCAFSPDGSYLAGKLSSGHILVYPSVMDSVSNYADIPSVSLDWFNQ